MVQLGDAYLVSSEYYPDTAALSPDERSVLFGDGSSNVWTVRELTTGEETPEPMLPAMGALLPGGGAHWIGDRVAIAQTRGGDYGIETVTTLTLATALPPRTLVAELRSPGPVLSLRATESDLWALSYGKGYEGDGPLPNERVLWRLDPTTAAPQLEVLASVRVGALDQLAAHGQHAYLADTDKLRSIARDGTLIRELPLPAPPTSIAASELGVFIADGSERLWQLAPDAESWTLLVTDCPACELRGAAGERVYVTLHSPRDARNEHTRRYDWQLGYEELRAYAIAPAGATLVGRDLLGSAEFRGAAAFDAGVDRVLINERSLRVLARLPEMQSSDGSKRER